MAIDYVALSQWGIVPALGVLITLTLTLSHKIYYGKILEKEDTIKNKIRDDVLEEVKNFNKKSKNEAISEKEFSERIKRIVKFNEILEESKSLFNKNLVVSAVLLVLLGIIFVVWTDKKDTLLMLGIIILGYHLFSWNSLRTNYSLLERFRCGENTKEILGENY